MKITIYQSRPIATFLIFALALLAIVAVATPAIAGGGPHNVLIVANSSSDDSLAVANAYRQARDIPQRNLCLIELDTMLFRNDMSVNWDVYLANIRKPIADFLARHPAPDELHFIVLMPDLPLRVAVPLDNPRANSPTHRSLSSLLTIMPDRKPPAVVGNPYNRTIGGFGQWLKNAPPRQRPPQFRLVTVLGGYNRDDALALITRSIAADNSAPKGTFYLIDSPHTIGLKEAAERLTQEGFKAVHLDNLTGVTQFENVMGHFSGGAYSKLTWPQIQSSSIRPGALVDMLQSYGARDLNWRGFAFASHVPLGWWIRAGATGVHGATNEPYAHTFPTSGMLQTLLANYLGGANLAESYYSSLRQLAWQNIIFGDALCAPYAVRGRLTLVAHPPQDGRILLSLKATLPTGRKASSATLYIDGAPLDAEPERLTPADAAAGGESSPSDDNSAGLPVIYQWHLPVADLTPGYHRARTVIADDTPAAVESWTTREFQYTGAADAGDTVEGDNAAGNGGGSLLVLSAEEPQHSPPAAGDELTFRARYEGPAKSRQIVLKRGLETLGTFADDGRLTIKTRRLGPGIHQLQALAVNADGDALAASRTLPLTLREPLHVIDAWPPAETGLNVRAVLIYDCPLPYATNELTNAATFTQNGRTIAATARIDENRLIVAPRAPLSEGPATLNVALPQKPERSRPYSQTLEIRDDRRFMYTMPADVHLRCVVKGRVTVNKGRIAVNEVRPAMVVIGPVDINEPQRPARWTMPAYEISARLGIGSSARKDRPATDGAGLGVHYQNIDNYAFVRVEAERIAAYEVTGGKQREVAHWNVPDGAGTSGNIPMSLTVVGPRVTVTVHGKRLGQFELSDRLQEGLPLVDLGSPRGVSAADIEVRRPR